MTTQELTTALFHRLKKTWLIIIISGIICGGALVFYALQKPVTYTSTASIFPLTSGADNSSTSMLSALMGTGENSKSFSDDASINIIELAQSRTTREEVAAIRVPEKGNKTIAELLVDDINTHRGFLEPEVKMPANEYALITWAGYVLRDGLTATINKNNSFVLAYTGRSPELVRTISYGFIDKISTFYIDLKREKAKRDFEFATSKVDSLRSVMNSKDDQLIAIDKRTMFTNTAKLEFRVPAENLLADKQMIRQQYATAVANQQNAAYKLQKATPVIKVLDKPEPPYGVQNKSPMLFGFIGFFVALIAVGGLLVSGILLNYFKEETHKALFGTGNEKSASPSL
ncbi:MAG: Wzz/FepE/Etk N-terminal domain-containing protein [Ginsengibacter sp.]